MSLEPGTEVNHPKLGKGTIVFDKPHCLQVDFVLYGLWNFSQAEWASQKVSPERLRGVHSLGQGALSDLEYALEELLESGEISEAEAMLLLEQKAHPLEVRRSQTTNINQAYRGFRSAPTALHAEDDFYEALLKYITVVVKSYSHDASTFSNIEDAIQIAAIKVWRNLDKFDGSRSSFARFVTVITVPEIRRLLKGFKRGQVALSHAEDLPLETLSADQTIAFNDWLRSLKPKDRAIVQMTLDGLTQEEIGEALGISHQAISKRLISLREVAKSPF